MDTKQHFHPLKKPHFLGCEIMDMVGVNGLQYRWLLVLHPKAPNSLLKNPTLFSDQLLKDFLVPMHRNLMKKSFMKKIFLQKSKFLSYSGQKKTPLK